MSGGVRRRVRSRRGLVVQVAAELLITVCLLTIMVGFWQLFWQNTQDAGRQSQAAQTLAHEWSGEKAAPAARTSTPPAPRPHHAFAVIHIPRFGHDWKPRPVIEGVTDDDLARGVGHYPGTALPGQVGNVAIAGHRMTHGSAFQQIGDLQVGDPVVIETRDSWYVYRVTGASIVTPDHLEVLEPVPGQPGATPTRRLLTLTSCHPMFGSTHRYIVTGVLESSTPRSAGRPAALEGRRG